MGRQIVYYFVLWVANYQMLRTTYLEQRSQTQRVMRAETEIRSRVALTNEETISVKLNVFERKNQFD